MSTRMRIAMDERDKGFTLIELLVVIIIIGILAAIAIPVFLSQRQKAVDASVKSDIMGLAHAQETWLVDNPSAIGTTDAAALAAAGFKRSPGNVFWVYLNATTGTYCLLARNPGDSMGGITEWGVVYDTASGGLRDGGRIVQHTTLVGAKCTAGMWVPI
jgi:type IV pilus assembly protein PilA